jgi:uncharacterized membrane protein YfcA
VTVLDLSVAELAIALLALVIASCLQGSIGFGLGLVGAPVLVLVDARLVPTVLLCIGVPLTLLIGWRERDSLDYAGIKWAVIGRVPGSIVGSLAVVALADRWLAGLFALAILLAVGLSVLGLTAPPTRRNLLIAGTVSGVMGTATSVGGPPIALVYQHNPGPELRASMAAFMVFGASISLIALGMVGEFSRDDLGLAALLLPGVVIGFGLSRYTKTILDAGRIRPAVLVFATASAVSILIRQVF